MQPVLVHLRWFAQPTRVAWVYGACALAALVFSLLIWRRRGRDPRRLAPWLGGGLAFAVLAYVKRDQLLPPADFVVTSSGASLVLSAITAWVVTLGLAGRAGVPASKAASAFFVAALAGVLSARWTYLLANPQAVVHWANWLSVRGGGLLGYPGLIVGLGVGAWWLARDPDARLGSLTARKWLDAAAPALALGSAIVRTGCYFFGCDYGRPLPEDANGVFRHLGVYPHWSSETLDGWGAPAWIAQVNTGAISETARESLPVHATQLYEASAGVLLFALLVWARPRCRKPGQAFGVFVLGYAWIRLTFDLLRGDAERGLLGPNLEGRLLLALGWIVWALLAGVAIEKLVRAVRIRAALRIGLLLPGLVLLVVRIGRPPWDPLRVSLTQWLALLSAAACAAAFHWIERQPSPGDEVEANAGPA